LKLRDWLLTIVQRCPVEVFLIFTKVDIDGMENVADSDVAMK
jgi:hypothetical protein